MINLTKEDWMEIYYAIKFKRDNSAAVSGDKRWIKQLDQILKKIGPDGTRAIKKGISKRSNFYTIILLIPQSHAEVFGEDTYYCTVKASSMTTAVEQARLKARLYIKDPDIDTSKLVVLGLFKGKLKDLVSKWNKSAKMY